VFEVDEGVLDALAYLVPHVPLGLQAVELLLSAEVLALSWG
jgi:hypothetical protein